MPHVVRAWDFAQIIINKTPSALLIIPACFLLAGALYWISHIGQVIADEQMNTIRAAIDQTLTPTV